MFACVKCARCGVVFAVLLGGASFSFSFCVFFGFPLLLLVVSFAFFCGRCCLLFLLLLCGAACPPLFRRGAAVLSFKLISN